MQVKVENFEYYDSFVFSSAHSDRDVWTLNGPFSGDFIAGLLVGMRILMTDILNKRIKSRYSIYVVKKKFSIHINILDLQGLINILHNYIVVDNIEDNNIDIYTTSAEHIGWWIRSSINNLYNLYKFTQSDFIQGFITICNSLQIDFRDYIAGHPFSVDKDNNKIFYDIIGYDIDLFNPPQKTPQQLEPFYTGPDYHGTFGNLRELDGDDDYE